MKQKYKLFIFAIKNILTAIIKDNKKFYRDFSDFLIRYFPYKTQKISINAGFTCPNRDGSKGRGGCTYCNNQSFSPGYGQPQKSVAQQIEEGKSFFGKKYPNMKFLAYFQSYTNTYGGVRELIALYEEALAQEKIVGLIVGTRPDCVSDELLDYFSELKKRCFVMIEYGIESVHDKTLEKINRLHTYEESRIAIEKTHERGIPVGAHLILGLPGETREDHLISAKEISKLPLSSVKLHQLQIIKGTVMAKQYRESPEMFHLFSVDEYIDLCIDFCEVINPEFCIERFSSQSPGNLLVSPPWGLKNYELTAKIIKRFAERNTYQGRLFDRS